MYQVSERRPNLRRAWAAATLIVLASVAAPINLDAQAASPPIAPRAAERSPSLDRQPNREHVSVRRRGRTRGSVASHRSRPADPTSSRCRRRCRSFGFRVALLGHARSPGTVYVVTAAHCVLTDSGEVTPRTVVRDDIRYTAVAVLVDTDYHDHPSAELDAAVLVMAQVIPGPSARVGSALPDSGQVTLAGLPTDRQRRHACCGATAPTITRCRRVRPGLGSTFPTGPPAASSRSRRWRCRPLA